MMWFRTFGSGLPRRVRRGCGKRAFTFIEIMMVVLIIGMLAAIVGPSMVHRAETARIKTAKIQMKTFQTALTGYEMLLGDYPNSEMGLDALVHRPPDVAEDKWEKQMDSIPLDPWRNPYVYRCPGENGNDYDVFSTGKDGKEGTEDDIWLHPPEENKK
jgi:general secretion pathway protein G